MDEQALILAEVAAQENAEENSGDGVAPPVVDVDENSPGHNNGVQVPRAAAEEITSLNDNDVLLGRGRGSSKFIGNLRFRDVVKQYKKEYNAATTHNDKVIIAHKVHAEITERGGRFLERINADGEQPTRSVIQTGTWKMAPTGVAVERCKQSLREKEMSQEERAIAKAKRKAKSAKQNGASAPPQPAPHQQVHRRNVHFGVPPPRQAQNYYMPMPPPYNMMPPGMLAPVDPRWLFFQNQQQQMARNGLYQQFHNRNYPPPPPPPNVYFNNNGGRIGHMVRPPVSEQGNVGGRPNGVSRHSSTTSAPKKGTKVSSAEKDAVSGLFALMSGDYSDTPKSD